MIAATLQIRDAFFALPANLAAAVKRDRMITINLHRFIFGMTKRDGGGKGEQR
ncbi:Uncharacterised protein [Vibrio cholerae]|nr:Uncharacterised protein [Vibrio cholerae]